MNIVLILCDALRYDRVNPRVMPYLTKLACKGVRYTMFYADGGTTKWSLPYFLSGQRKYDPSDNFPKKLTQAGIHNEVIHSNAVLCVEKYQECFKEHRDTGVETAPLQIELRNKLRKTPLWKHTRGIRKLLVDNIDVPYRRAENVLQQAQKQIDLNGEGFYWVHLMDPHIPYSSPNLNQAEKQRADKIYELLLGQLQNKNSFPPTLKDELESLYDDECSYMDTQLQKFIEQNPETLFIITSDHGEMFGENHSYSHGPYYHGMTLQLGHVPFIVYGPRVVCKTVTDYHASIDVGATILDLFNLDPVQGYGCSMREDLF